MFVTQGISMVFLDKQAKGNQIRSRNFGWFADVGLLLSTYSNTAHRIVQYSRKYTMF